MLASASPRAVETTVAMGFAVDDTVAMPSGYVPGEVEHHEQWSWPRPYLRYAELLGQGRGLAAVAEAHRAIWAQVAGSVPDGPAGLVVAHGGAIGRTLVACLPDADHAGWGEPFGHCEAACLGYAGGRFVTVRLRRTSAPACGAGPG